MCCEETLPSEECELPDEGACGGGACGGRNAGCGKGNDTGSWKASAGALDMGGNAMPLVGSKSSWKKNFVRWCAARYLSGAPYTVRGRKCLA